MAATTVHGKYLVWEIFANHTVKTIGEGKFGG